jgi:hypothetical protein
MSRVEYYLPLRHILTSDGECVLTCGEKLDPSVFYAHREYEAEEISEESSQIKEVYITERIETDSMERNYTSYSDNMADLYVPKMEKGKWLTELGDEKELYAVASASYSADVGDTVELKISDGKKVTIRICGKLAPDAKVISSNDVSVNFDDFRDIYQNTDQPMLFFRSRDVEKHGIDRHPCGIVFVIYKDGLGKEAKLDLHRTLYCYGSNFKLREELNSASLKYIFKDVMLLMPITICLFAMVLVCSCVSSAVSIKKNIRTYSIFSLCGATKNKNIEMILTKDLLIGVGGTLITALLIRVYMLGMIKSTVYLSMGRYQLICLLLIVLTELLLSWLTAEGMLKKGIKNDQT